MPKSCWLNGETVPVSAATISPADRGFLFGDGLFETLRGRAGRACLAEEHLARLRSSAEFFKLPLPYSDLALTGAMETLLARNGLPEARIKLLVSRGRHAGNLGLPAGGEPTVLITTEALPPNLGEIQQHGVRLAISPVVMPRNWLLARHKTLNRLPYLLAREQAQAVGAYDALLFDEQSQVAETTTANLFLVRGGGLYTPPLEAPILPGVTRAAVLEMAREKGLRVREKDFPLYTVFESEEVFLTGAVAELVPVLQVENSLAGSGRPGPVTRELQAAFPEWARSKARAG